MEKGSEDKKKKSVKKKLRRSEYRSRDWEWPKSYDAKWPMDQRILYLKHQCEEVGIDNIVKKNVAAIMGVSTATMTKDFKALLKAFKADPVEIEEARISLRNLWKATIKRTHEIIKDGSPRESARAMRNVATISSGITDYFERWGLKEETQSTTETHFVLEFDNAIKVKKKEKKPEKADGDEK